MVCPHSGDTKKGIQIGSACALIYQNSTSMSAVNAIYPSTTPTEAVADITQSKAKYFTVFDALKGYHQCPLDKESQKLTTFITPFGRFKYLRAPYEISSISEHYDRRMDEAFAGLGDFRKIVDDIVVFDSDRRSHVEHVRQMLHR